MRWIDPVTSSIMFQHNLMALFDRKKEPVLYHWVEWSQISKQMPLAAIAAEDQRFANHFGIDFHELTKVIKADSANRRGASTITQQVAKNLYLWGGRSYLRKALEAGIALLIEASWSKQRILEVYLNIAQFSANVYGVEQASKKFFNTAARHLNRDQAARLAAVLPSPTQFSVTDPSKYVLKRQRWIMQQMKQLGGIKVVDHLE